MITASDLSTDVVNCVGWRVAGEERSGLPLSFCSLSQNQLFSWVLRNSFYFFFSLFFVPLLCRLNVTRSSTWCWYQPDTLGVAVRSSHRVKTPNKPYWTLSNCFRYKTNFLEKFWILFQEFSERFICGFLASLKISKITYCIAHYHYYIRQNSQHWNAHMVSYPGIAVFNFVIFGGIFLC